MKMKFFWIPARDSAAAEAELNAFFARTRVVQVEKAFTADADGPGWSICVQWLAGNEEAAASAEARGARVDYREVLDAPTFHIFSALRTWRKERAAADAVPIYTVATNEQLAQIARERIVTPAALARVPGFGQSRLGKYAESLLALCQREMAPPASPPTP